MLGRMTEAAYYENPDFWRDEMFATSADRFAETAGLIPADAKTLLDVGCGNGAFLRHVMASGRAFDRIHATDRSQAALARVQAPHTHAEIEALPFGDREFEAVTCLEVIEHLPHGIYEAGIANLARITDKYLIVSVPYRQNLSEGMVRCPSCEGRFHPDYHWRSYDDDSLTALFRPWGFDRVDYRLGGAKPEFWFVSSYLDRKARPLETGNPFDTAIPCPMCNYELPPTGSAHVASPPPVTSSSGIKALAKKLLHRGTSYGWIINLYARHG
jgi:SAM-dependent methyltransferase